MLTLDIISDGDQERSVNIIVADTNTGHNTSAWDWGDDNIDTPDDTAHDETERDDVIQMKKQ